MKSVASQTLIFYALTTILAVALGICLVSIIRPGHGADLASSSSSSSNAGSSCHKNGNSDDGKWGTGSIRDQPWP